MEFTEGAKITTQGSSTGLSSKSELYKIYSNGDIDINDEMDNTELYSNLTHDINKHTTISDSEIISKHGKKDATTTSKILKVSSSVAILGALGNAFLILLEFIDHNSKIELPNIKDYKLLFIIEDFLSQYNFNQFSELINNATIGIALGTIEIIMAQLPSSSWIRRDEKKIDSTNTVIRSLVAITGIAYGLKKLEWESALQASLAWSLLNPCLWILLDGTIYGFFVDSTVSIIFAGLSYLYDPSFFQADLYDKLLYIGSAAFVGLLILGKVGRWLFN